MVDLCPYNWRQWSPGQYTQEFLHFLEQFCATKIDDIMNELDTTSSYGVPIDMLELINFNNQLGTVLLYHPLHVLPFCDDAIIRLQAERMKSGEAAYSMIPKPHTFSRLESLPLCQEITKPNVSCIRNCDIGRFLSVPGTVIRTGSVKTLEWKRVFECKKCKHRFAVVADLEQRSILPLPQSCPSTDTICNSTKFAAVEAETMCRDYQEIKVQEKVQQLDMGSIPRSIVVVVMDELADVCKPGDDVNVFGTLLRRWMPVIPDKRCELEMVLLANNLRVANDTHASALLNDESRREFEQFWSRFEGQPLRGRSVILRSICPQLHGLFLPKLAMLLTVIGGVPYLGDGGHRIRGEGHMLMIGDPGLGKSQLLKYAAKLSPRSVLTTGVGSTSAGLTTSAAKDGGEWVLEAGALVLADGGLCCIDEFSSLREHDRTAIHEAMEQQSISVAKAGLVCKLQSRCSVLAATNPKTTTCDPAEMGLSSGISAPLLSRFDVVIVLQDIKEEKKDELIADFVLGGWENLNKAGGSQLTLNQIQLYLAYTRQHFLPQMSQDAETILQRYYTLLRGSNEVGAARTTIRMLESLVRLAQSHARLMHHQEVHRMDALVAVWILETSNGGNSVIAGSADSSEFPEEPDYEYRDLELNALRHLGLTNGPNNVLVEAAYNSNELDESFTQDQHHPMAQKGGLTQQHCSQRGSQNVWSMFSQKRRREDDDDDNDNAFSQDVYTTMR